MVTEVKIVVNLRDPSSLKRELRGMQEARCFYNSVEERERKGVKEIEGVIIVEGEITMSKDLTPPHHQQLKILFCDSDGTEVGKWVIKLPSVSFYPYASGFEDYDPEPASHVKFKEYEYDE